MENEIVQNSSPLPSPEVLSRAPLETPGQTSNDLDRVESDVKAIRQSLGSASRDQTSILLKQLRAISGRLPTHGRRARRSAGMIQMAITQAEQQLEALSDESGRFKEDSHARHLFQVAVYATMSGQAKKFYNEIDKKTTYTLAPVKDGMVVDTVKKEVHGEELRKKFSLLKYHSMSEAEKKDVLHSTFGMINDLIPDNLDKLKAERDDVFALHQALKDMEAYKAYMSISKLGGSIRNVLVDVANDHEGFARAHVEVDMLVAAYDKLMVNPKDEQAIAAFKAARMKMRKTLKDDVIDKILLNNDSGGLGRDIISPPITPILPIDRVFSLFKP